jgi:hypothetical protein
MKRKRPMGEIVSAILQFIVGLEGKKFWKLVIGGIVVLGIVLALESRAHFLSSIGNKNDIEVMSMLLELEKNGVLDSDNLKEEYLELVESYRKQRRFTVLPVGIFKTPSSPQEQFYKFASGTLLFGLIGLAYFFTAKEVSLGDRIGGFVMILFSAVILGIVAMLIPTFRSPWINYIGMPILQLALLIIAAIFSTRKEEEKDAAKGAEK